MDYSGLPKPKNAAKLGGWVLLSVVRDVTIQRLLPARR